MTLSMKKLFFTACGLAVAFTLLSTSALAQDIFAVNGGRTTVQFDVIFLSALTRGNVIPTAADTSQFVFGAMTFPITSGAISVSTKAGQIAHSGGIKLTSGKTTVKLDGLVIDTLTGSSSVSTLLEVNGIFVGRVKLFDFSLPTDVSEQIVPDNGTVYLTSVKLTLDEEAATALNRAFASKLMFIAGSDVGTLQSMALIPLPTGGLAGPPIFQ